MSNYRCVSKEEALSFVKGDIRLFQCVECGLVFNASFEDGLCLYDEKYDNSQSLSIAFKNHVADLIKSVSQSCSLKRILELGCGKGDFLNAICASVGARGDGYDTTYSGPDIALHGQVRYFKKYVLPGDIGEKYDLILCRHVVEHIGEIGVFLDQLKKIAEAAGNPLIVIETPRLEWIVEGRCFWDIFYEHCNYFSETALEGICHRSGFQVVSNRSVFGGQYQSLELRLATDDVEPRKDPVLDLGGFSGAMDDKREKIRSELGNSIDKNWAVWGAGAKGVCFVNGIDHPRPKFVFDINPNKCGGFVPGAGIRVVPPTAEFIKGIEHIFIMNPNYHDEIKNALQNIQYAGLVSVLG